MPKVVPGYKKEARGRILDAAFEVFAEKGYPASTMDDIAEKVGVSKGALYLYFRSKEELFRAILDSEEAFLTEFLTQALRLEDLEHEAGVVFDQIAGELHRHIALTYDLMAAASRNDKLREMIRQHSAKEIRVAEEFIRGLRKKGLVRSDVPLRSQSLSVIGLFLGLMMMIPIVQDRSVVRQAWVAAVRSLMLPSGTPRTRKS